MAVVPPRDKVLFLPVVRGRGYDLEWTRSVSAALRDAAQGLGVPAIFPSQNVGYDGLLGEVEHVAQYYAEWKGDLGDVRALIAFSSDFMRERVVQDVARLLPADVPVFLMVNNDEPRAMVEEGKAGDSLCGSLSVHHNLRMLGRRIFRSCRINMLDGQVLRRFLRQYVRMAEGVECLRNMRIGMLGLNPESFATTFTNQIKLFELGFSLHTYELLTLWGDTILAKQVANGATEYEGELGQINLWRPIAAGDERVQDVKQRLAEMVDALPDSDWKVDAIARCFLWVKDVFERDGIDTGAIHCWSEFTRFYGMAPCTVAMLSNAWLRRPLVCEQDVCHAIMAKLAWALTDEAGVILDINNNGWDAHTFNVFHCSQTPPNWLVEPGKVSGWGSISGVLQEVPFTAISAATTSDDFQATVFQGRFLGVRAGNRGSSGWAFVPNLPEVLRAIEAGGIHHFVALKGHSGRDVADVLAFRGLTVTDLSQPVPEAEELGEVPPSVQALPEQGCPVFSE